MWEYGVFLPGEINRLINQDEFKNRVTITKQMFYFKSSKAQNILKLVVSFLLIFLSLENVKSQSHILKYDSPVYSCSNDGVVSSSLEMAPAGSKIDSITLDQTKSYVIIQFLKWTPPSPTETDVEFKTSQLLKINTFNYTLDGNADSVKIKQAQNFFYSDTPRKRFAIKKENFSGYASKYVKPNNWDFTAGALTIPFKLRPKPFDFSKDITMGASGALGYKFKGFTLYGVLSLGISSISIDSLNTEGKEKY
ncbi:MAG: hypothetical protein ACHQRM_00775 [Bacteroidia bacterium]